MTQIASFVVDLYNKCDVLRQKTSLNHVRAKVTSNLSSDLLRDICTTTGEKTGPLAFQLDLNKSNHNEWIIFLEFQSRVENCTSDPNYYYTMLYNKDERVCRI